MAWLAKGFFSLQEWTQTPKETNKRKKITKEQNIEDLKLFFGENLSSVIWQWPTEEDKEIDKTEEIEEPLTPEMETEIKKTFWEHYDKFII
jgi:hypothetical protein